ncbi:MAG TPA: hypothetical protein VIY09_04355, partial [Rhizomicrobium sp.]
LYPGHTPVDFEANGTGGQRITVIPSLDMVEVMTGGGFDANQVQQLIAAAPKSNTPLPPNPGAEARLAALSAELVEAPAAVREATLDTGPIPIPRPKPQPAPRTQAVVAEIGTPKAVTAAAPAMPAPRAKPHTAKS